MAKRVQKEKLKGRRLAMTIILGVFVAIMLTIFVNLFIGYVYEGPQYEKYCPAMAFDSQFPAKTIPGTGIYSNCTFDDSINKVAENCSSSMGQPRYNYDSRGCVTSFKSCDMCSKNFDDAQKAYNRKVFFIFAIIGFALIVFGLFNRGLLMQIVSLPSGAFLVIEAATKNFDDKLFVIIVFGLLIIGALYLAIKKFKLN
jgi:hypothetical protein